MELIECEKCEYQWLPRTEKPKKCPKCGHYLNERKRVVKQSDRIAIEGIGES